jgi:hypothetical protein
MDKEDHRMTTFLAPGTRVVLLCPHRRTRLRREVIEHLTVGPRAGWVALRKPDGSVEHRTVDTLVVEPPEEAFLARQLEFYHRDEGQVLERRPLSGIVGQLTWARAEVSRAFRVPEHRIGIRLAA